jgi:sugar lactone lactonase YvrE
LPAPNGRWLAAHGGDGAAATKATFFSPRSGAIDLQGNFYIADGLADSRFHTIRKVTPLGQISTYAGIPDQPGAFLGENLLAEKCRLNGPNQLYVTPSEDLYVADTENHCIRKNDLTTNLMVTVAGVGGRRAEAPDAEGTAATTARLNAPTGVAVDTAGNIFIAEKGMGRLLVVKPNGKLYTLAGGGSAQADGDARLITLLEPSDLAFDQDGSLLLSDSRANKVWRFGVQYGF